jgi:hypothetical protein
MGFLYPGVTSLLNSGANVVLPIQGGYDAAFLSGAIRITLALNFNTQLAPWVLLATCVIAVFTVGTLIIIADGVLP